jgi:hypothetical protein
MKFLTFPSLALILGATITAGSILINNKEGIVAGSGFLAAGGTAFQVEQENKSKAAQSRRSSSTTPN